MIEIPAAEVVLNVLANALERIVIANDMFVVVALPFKLDSTIWRTIGVDAGLYDRTISPNVGARLIAPCFPLSSSYRTEEGAMNCAPTMRMPWM